MLKATYKTSNLFSLKKYEHSNLNCQSYEYPTIYGIRCAILGSVIQLEGLEKAKELFYNIKNAIIYVQYPEEFAVNGVKQRRFSNNSYGIKMNRILSNKIIDSLFVPKNKLKNIKKDIKKEYDLIKKQIKKDSDIQINFEEKYCDYEKLLKGEIKDKLILDIESFINCIFEDVIEKSLLNTDEVLNNILKIETTNKANKNKELKNISIDIYEYIIKKISDIHINDLIKTMGFRQYVQLDEIIFYIDKSIPNIELYLKNIDWLGTAESLVYLHNLKKVDKLENIMTLWNREENIHIYENWDWNKKSTFESVYMYGKEKRKQKKLICKISNLKL